MASILKIIKSVPLIAPPERPIELTEDVPKVTVPKVTAPKATNPKVIPKVMPKDPSKVVPQGLRSKRMPGVLPDATAPLVAPLTAPVRPKNTPKAVPEAVSPAIPEVPPKAAQQQKKKKAKQQPPASKQKPPKVPKPVQEVIKDQRLAVLTDAEKKNLVKIQSKWQKVACSTDRINRKRATTTIKAVYAYANKPAPEILFCESPNLGMLTQLWSQQKVYTPNYLLRKIRHRINKAVRSTVARVLRIELHDYFFETRLCGFSTAMYQDLTEQIASGLEQHGGDRTLICPANDRPLGDESEEPNESEEKEAYHLDRMELSFFAYYDFVRQLIDPTKGGYDIDKEWRLMQAMAKECQWSFMFENVCVVCDRPKRIVKSETGETRIEFADGTLF